MVTVSKKEFIQALDVVVLGVAKARIAPVLQGIEVCVGDKLTLSSTDSEVSVEAEVEGTVEESFDVVVDGKTFVQAAKKLKRDSVSLSIKDGVLLMQSGRSKYKMQIIEGSLPKVDTPETTVCIVTSDMLQKAIRQTIFATDDDNLQRPFSTGVYFDGNAVSTDSSRLAISPIGIDGDFIVPARCLSLVNKLKGGLKVNKGEDYISFASDKVKVITRIIDSKYPDYKNLIPADAPVKATVSRKKFLDAVDCASVIEGDKVGALFSIGDGKITIQCSDNNTYEESIDCETEGTCDVSLSSHLVKDFLKAAEGEEVTCWFNDELKPCKLSCDDYEYVLMPIRTR